MARTRGDKGKFIQKSSEPRLVRSIRATNSTWENLGRIASERCITRADLIEYFASNHVLHESLKKENQALKQQIVRLKSQALDIKDKNFQCELPLISQPTTTSKKEVTSNSYPERAFAKETGINRSTLANRKKKYLEGLISEEDFYNYLFEHDPQSRSWRYCRERKRYYY